MTHGQANPRVYLGPDRKPLLLDDGTPMPRDEVLRVWARYYADLENTPTIARPHAEDYGRRPLRRPLRKD